MNNSILLVFGKSYQDSTNNERYFKSIIVFNVHSMLRDIEYGIGLSLHILYYSLLFHIIIAFILFLLRWIYYKSLNHCAYKQALLGIGGHFWLN